MFRYFSTITFWTLFSRFLGYGRDVALAALLGVGAFLDAFLIAFTLPNLLRAFVAEGAVNSGFISIYAEKLEKEKKQAFLFSGEAILLMMGIILILVILAEIFMPAIIIVIAGGFLKDPEKFNLTVYMARLMFPYIFMIAQVALFSGILQSHKIFGVPAFSACLLNIAFWGALGVIFIRPDFDHGFILGVSLLLGGMLQWGVVVFICWKRGLMPLFTGKIISADTKKMLKLTLPMMFLAGIVQINFMINRSLVSYLQEGSVLFLFYAERLIQLPVGLFGATVGVVLLPILSRDIASENKERFFRAQNQSFNFIMLMGVPASFALIVLSDAVIFSIFGYGAFSKEAVIQTAIALRFMAVGVPAFLLGRFLLSIFFALKDIRTPLWVGMGQAVLNVGMSLAFISFFQHAGVALSVSLSAWVGCLLFLFILQKREVLKISSQSWHQTIKIVVAALIMAVVLVWLNSQWRILLIDNAFIRLSSLGFFIICGVAVYGSLLFFFKALTVDILRTYFQKD